MDQPNTPATSAPASGSAASCAMVNVHGSGVCGKPATHKSGKDCGPNYWCEHHAIILRNAGYNITRIKPPNDKLSDRRRE